MSMKYDVFGQIDDKLALVPVYLKNFHDSWDICPMGFVYSIQIC